MGDRLKEIQEEVDLMNKSFNEGIVTDAPGTDVPSTDDPSTDTPVTDAPGTDAPSTDAPSTDSPTTDAPDEKDQIIEELRAKLAEKENKPTTEAPTTEAPLPIDEQDFLGDQDLDDVISDKSSFNKLLNQVYSKGLNDARKVLGENVLRSIPDIVKTNVVMISNLQKANEEFYAQNEDLKPFKKVVATVFEELSSEHPEKRFDEVLKDVAPEVRKRLELHKKAATPPSNKPNPTPRLPRKKGKSGRPSNQPNPNPLQAELEEMNKTLGR